MIYGFLSQLENQEAGVEGGAIRRTVHAAPPRSPSCPIQLTLLNICAHVRFYYLFVACCCLNSWRAKIKIYGCTKPKNTPSTGWGKEAQNVSVTFMMWHNVLLTHPSHLFAHHPCPIFRPCGHHNKHCDVYFLVTLMALVSVSYLSVIWTHSPRIISVFPVWLMSMIALNWWPPHWWPQMFPQHCSKLILEIVNT